MMPPPSRMSSQASGGGLCSLKRKAQGESTEHDDETIKFVLLID